jgi:hypothetical protein
MPWAGAVDADLAGGNVGFLCHAAGGSKTRYQVANDSAPGLAWGQRRMLAAAPTATITWKSAASAMPARTEPEAVFAPASHGRHQH